MSRSIFSIFVSILIISPVLLLGCSQGEESEHSVVESGTYTGEVTEVNAEEDEIYVGSNGRELELYFTEQTTLSRGGQPVDFSALENGQEVKVKIKKVGKRLDPLSVKILE